MGRIFDSHAHYDDDIFLSDRDVLLKKLFSTNVCGIVNIGADLLTSQKSVELSCNYEKMWCAVGVHPSGVEELSDDYIEKLSDMISSSDKVVAVGEIGLDYYYNKENSDKQKRIFEQQLELAVSRDKPVVIHDRDAHADTLNLLNKYRPKGIVHCFSGSVEMAREVVDMGMYVGIGGAVTFKNAKTKVRVVENLPLDKIVLETDAPYMAPEPFRGKRCDSSHIMYTAQKIAEIKGVDVDTVLECTTKNSLRVYELEGRV